MCHPPSVLFQLGGSHHLFLILSPSSNIKNSYILKIIWRILYRWIKEKFLPLTDLRQFGNFYFSLHCLCYCLCCDNFLKAYYLAEFNPIDIQKSFDFVNVNVLVVKLHTFLNSILNFPTDKFVDDIMAVGICYKKFMSNYEYLLQNRKWCLGRWSRPL